MTPVEKLHKQLIQINSTSDNENQIGEFLIDLLKTNGFDVNKNIVDENGFNVIVKYGEPRVYLEAHMDTVSPFLEFKETKTEIFGRGACDTKGCIASMIIAGIQAKNNGLNDFGFIFTVGEENTFRGAKRIIESKIKIPFVIVGEPTSLEIVNSHYGMLTLKLMAKGKTAHSSRPEKGINAIDILLNDLEKIKKIKFNTKTLVNITKINGGTADNIIPDYAEAFVNFRIHPEDKIKYFQKFKKIFPELVIEQKLRKSIKTQIPKELSFIKKVKEVKYMTELSFLKNGVVLGPGNIEYAHSINEKIEKSELNKAVEIYYQIIKNYNL